MTPIHDDLLAAIDAVEISSSTRYSVLGRQGEVPDQPSPVGTTDVIPAIVTALEDALYMWLYIRPQPLHSATWGDTSARRDLIAALSKANAGRGAWEPGWTIRRVAEDGGIVAARYGIAFRIPATGYRTPDGSAREGGACRVRVPKELRESIRGFYMAIGDGRDDPADDGDAAGPDVRYYWHLTPVAAVPFVAAATSRLNAAGIPFRLKVVDEPGGYRRADAGLIFLSGRHRPAAREAIAEIYAAVAPLLRPDVPLFTRRLADGLGFAEDPPGGLSFGQYRCRLVARSLWDSFLLGGHGRDARASALASAFHREGLDPLRPHLGPGGTDHDPIAIPPGRPASPPAAPGAPTLLEAAIGIGRAICRSAWWDREGRHCNWMGRTEAELTAIGGPITPTLSALGPYVYGGSAGIALFLARLHERTGDPEFRLAARGAIANALRQLERATATISFAPLSFFCGHVGLAYAAHQVGPAEMADRVRALLDIVAVAIDEPHVLDVIGGNAGAIPALLSMARSPGLGRCRDLAIAMAEDLCRTAIRQDGVCRWDPERASVPGMASALSSGMSHGAAGIGLALLEAYAASSREDFLETARGAFAYEDSLFDPEAVNWRDLRLPPREPAFARGWCHGAPGIALSRLRAVALDPDRRESYLETARLGLANTGDAIEEGLAASRYDATPVNGLSGLIEILWTAGRMLDDPSHRERAEDAVRALIARHAASGDWPSGAPSGGPNPSLMIGNAGIGHTFLRLHDPEHVPSILWIGIGPAPEIPRARVGAGG